MSNFDKLSKDLPPSKGTFQIEVEGEVTKTRYVGDFSCKILTRKDRAMVSKHRAFLNGPLENQLDVPTLHYHYKIAYLRFALTEYPNFWKNADLGYDLYDGNVVEVVYDRVIQFEDDYLTQVWGEDKIRELSEARKDDDSEG